MLLYLQVKAYIKLREFRTVNLLSFVVLCFIPSVVDLPESPKPSNVLKTTVC